MKRLIAVGLMLGLSMLMTASLEARLGGNRPARPLNYGSVSNTSAALLFFRKGGGSAIALTQTASTIVPVKVFVERLVFNLQGETAVTFTLWDTDTTTASANARKVMPFGFPSTISSTAASRIVDIDFTSNGMSLGLPFINHPALLYDSGVNTVNATIFYKQDHSRLLNSYILSQ